MSIKQANFRIEESDANNFRRFCEENGFNQAQGFDHIMQILELNKAKEVTPTRQTEIEEFERSMKTVLNAYLNSIEINNNAEARIREGFSTDLKTKDKTISELQEKVETLKKEKQRFEEQKEEYMQSADQAIKKYEMFKEQLHTASQLVAEKEKTIISLTEKLTSADKKIQRYDELEKEHKETLIEIIDLKSKISDMEKDFAIEKKELNAEMERKISDTQKDAALEIANAVRSKEIELNEKIRSLEMDKVKLETIIDQIDK